MKDNHEEHDDHEGHERPETLDDRDAQEESGDDWNSPRSMGGMRLPSPLSKEAEEVMSLTIGAAIAVHRALGPGFLESI